MSAEPWAEIYKAVRAHEVLLNEAASRFEHAALTPLITLNGGGIVAFLTLLGANADIRWQRWLAGLAILVWGAGLAAAALAVHFAFQRQRAINQGYRLMREDLEEALYGGKVSAITKPPAATSATGPTSSLRLIRRWTERRLKAEREKAGWNREQLADHARETLVHVEQARRASMVLFGLGGLAALIAILLAGGDTDTGCPPICRAGA